MIFLRCASLSNLPIVAVIPLPIAAASLANCDLALLGAASPFAACFCCSDRRDCRCCVIGAFCRLCACATMVRNSFVRSCIDVTIFLAVCTIRFTSDYNAVREAVDRDVISATRRINFRELLGRNDVKQRK